MKVSKKEYRKLFEKFYRHEFLSYPELNLTEVLCLSVCRCSICKTQLLCLTAIVLATCPIANFSPTKDILFITQLLP